MSKHRRLELEHFCLQYYEWKKELEAIDPVVRSDFNEHFGYDIPDPTFNTALKASFYRDRMRMIEECANVVDLGSYIFKAVTEGVTFPYFEARGIPCCRTYFYDRLKEFFFILDKVRA